MKHRVVLVQFPFDDLSSAKVRPAVCLTEPVGPHQHLILAFVTSRVPASPLKTDLIIDANGADFAATGLRVSSTIQLHRLVTVTGTMLRRELGVLSPALRSHVQERLRKLFELGEAG
jgi:mRNA interferase MazF